MKSGDLARLINVMGADLGLCVFISKRIPNPDDRLERDQNLWHFDILHDGRRRLLCTNDWTLIPTSDPHRDAQILQVSRST